MKILRANDGEDSEVQDPAEDENKRDDKAEAHQPEEDERVADTFHLKLSVLVNQPLAVFYLHKRTTITSLSLLAHFLKAAK